MPLSVDHTLSRESHRAPLILARSVVSVASVAGLESLDLCRFGRADDARLARVVSLEVQARDDVAVSSAVGHLESDAVSFAEAASLPCSENVEEAAETKHYEDLNRASGFTISRTRLHRHGLI